MGALRHRQARLDDDEAGTRSNSNDNSKKSAMVLPVVEMTLRIESSMIRPCLHAHNGKGSAETSGAWSCREREDFLRYFGVDGRHFGKGNQGESWYAAGLIAQKSIAPFTP